MLTLNHRLSLGPKVARTAALCLLALGAALSHSREARAQWTTPDTAGNINNTNTGNVGIGTSTPTVKLAILDTSTSQVNRGVGIGQVSNDANGALLSLSKSRGIPSAQTPAANGDSLATILAYGHDGVGHIASSRIRFAVNGTVGTTSVPTALPLRTGASGGGTQRMVISSGGNVGIGTTTPTTAKLVIGGTAGLTGLDLSSTDQYAEM